VSKAVSSVVANLIGAKRHDEIGLVASTGVRILLIFSAVLGCVLFPAPDMVLRFFLPGDIVISPEVWSMLRNSLFWSWVTVIGEALLFLWSGVLMAFGIFVLH